MGAKKGGLLHPTTMHTTHKDKDLFICLLMALAGLLLGLALVHQIRHEPAVSRANWPTPAEIQR